MTYLNIILTINTIILGIIAFGFSFLAYHDMTMSRTKFVRDNDEDDDCEEYDCCCEEDDCCYEYYDLSKNKVIEPTIKIVKCSREFGMCRE